MKSPIKKKKSGPKLWVVYDYEAIYDKLKDPRVKDGDTIRYTGNNQEDVFEAKVGYKGQKKVFVYPDNEFGKKGDAKKAMKLKWKEGISLKEAWKRVQKKTSKKDKKLSPEKKKAISNAKKAMKLKWKEDIPLKEAWKRVKESKKSRFGDTVCPQGYEPNKKWTGKRGQQLCVKECGFYQMRDPETNRCRNMQMVKASNGEKKMLEVPEGYEFNEETGRLRKKCLPGQYRDPVTKRCRRIRTEDSLQPLIAPSLFGTAFTMKKNARGHPFNSFGKKCGFGSCASCNLI